MIFKRKMPESFAHERCLDHLMRNFSAKLLADAWLNPARKLLAGCIAFCDSDLCAKLFADGEAKSCAKLSK